MYVCQIALDIPLRKNYSYKSTDNLQIGQRVIVEFNNRQHVGFVISITPQEQFHEYPIEKILPILQTDKYILDENTIKFANFTSQYYHHPFGETLFCGLPALIKKIDVPKVTNETKVYYRTFDQQKVSPSQTIQSLYDNLTIEALNIQQMRNILKKNPKSIIDKWLGRNLIQQVEAPKSYITQNELLLNDEQQQIIDNCQNYWQKFHVGLLYGITGSGKTEVFLHLIRQALEKNLQILTLVPEINLTPQLLARFHDRFPHANIAILNSEVTDKQRFTAWLQAKSGEIDIVIGTRLSVFTSFANLGLIIIDEEHDGSLKQNEGLRYHARDLAIWRASQLQIPIILASATPSLETLYNYKLGKYHLYKLTKRAVNKSTLPEIHTINLQHYAVNHAGISDIALEKLAKCLKRKEMALVFINRRGYAPIISCYDCGWVSTCNHCSSSMVYHHNDKIIKCHHCGYHTKVPQKCPKCNNQYLHTIGYGTQKLEEFLTQYFASAKIKRIDRDTTKNKKDWQNIYSEIENNNIDILIGTQMLAKGHDFPNLTLVIGLNLDNALFSYDFRASEDMFNIITQVSGRAGRGTKKGEVLLQTNYPEHPVYKFIQNHDFNGFINYILKERKEHNLPPFTFYAIIKFSSLQEEKLQKAMKEIHSQAKKIPHQEIVIFDAIKAVIYKISNRYRGQILISSHNRNKLHQYLTELEQYIKPNKDTSIIIDIDPLDV